MRERKKRRGGGDEEEKEGRRTKSLDVRKSAIFSMHFAVNYQSETLTGGGGEGVRRGERRRGGRGYEDEEGHSTNNLDCQKSVAFGRTLRGGL